MSWSSWHFAVIFSVTNGCCQFADTCIGQLLVRLIHIVSSSFSWYLDPGNNLLSCHILGVFMPIGLDLLVWKSWVEILHDSVGACVEKIWKCGAKTSCTDGSSNCNFVSVFCWCFFVWIKSVSHICGRRLWWVLDTLCKGCTSAASLTDGLDMILMAGSIVWESSIESVDFLQVWKHSFLTDLYFLSNWPSHFLCGHHRTFIPK